MKSFKSFIEELESKIQNSYTEGVSMEQAERLAGEFLGAQLAVSSELKKADLDSRMRKSGVKAVRASIYKDILKNNEKKPTEAQIAATIDTDSLVASEQQALDVAEVERDELERYYSIFQNAHVYYRGIAKGSFGG